ncbi:MAG TPA: ATP-binding protein, partial [Myxococcota bacterium]|nr:ATP-binding protein [Myxococcota bacterium]
NNLIQNAVQFARREVSVTIHWDRAAVTVEIADDGPGFSSAQLAAAPEPFASAKRGHLGLGLYTAERILFASGGSLRRENGPKGGARVTAFLLAAAEPSASPRSGT